MYKQYTYRLCISLMIAVMGSGVIGIGDNDGEYVGFVVGSVVGVGDCAGGYSGGSVVISVHHKSPLALIIIHHIIQHSIKLI